MNTLLSYFAHIQIPNTVAADAAEKFRVYRDFLSEQNKLFNLTAVTDPQEIVIKHFIDSLAALPLVRGKIADIGTGAGFPGLPLAILRPQCSFTLIDSLQKRIRLLDETVQKLSLQNVVTVHSRAEDLPKTVLYDTVVSRAVSRLPTLAEYCLPFTARGGLFIAYKADDCEEEVREAEKAIRILGGKIAEIQTVTLYGTEIRRKLICIEKTGDTPLLYPRSGNKPKKQPLC